MKAGGSGHSAPIGLGSTGDHGASEGRMGSSGPDPVTGCYQFQFEILGIKEIDEICGCLHAGPVLCCPPMSLSFPMS